MFGLLSQELLLRADPVTTNKGGAIHQRADIDRLATTELDNGLVQCVLVSNA